MAGDESNGLKALLILTATELLGGQKIAGHSLPEVVALLKQEYLIHRGNATRYRDLVTTEAQGHEKTKRALTEEQAGHATEREAHTATCTEYEAAQGGYEAAHTEFEEARGAWEQERSGLEGTNSGLEAAVAARDKTIEELQDTLRTTNANANTTRELLNYMTEAHQRAGEQLADIYELLTGESAPDKGDLDVTSLVTALDTDDTPTLTPLMAAYTQLAEQEGNVIERMGELQGRLDTLEENLTQALENAEGQESAQRTALKKASERAEGLAATVEEHKATIVTFQKAVAELHQNLYDSELPDEDRNQPAKVLGKILIDYKAILRFKEAYETANREINTVYQEIFGEEAREMSIAEKARAIFEKARSEGKQEVDTIQRSYEVVLKTSENVTKTFYKLYKLVTGTDWEHKKETDTNLEGHFAFLEQTTRDVYDEIEAMYKKLPELKAEIERLEKQCKDQHELLESFDVKDTES